MGPRSRERGDDGYAAAPELLEALLQWGRAHVSAEIKLEQLCKCCIQMLQWGRAHVSAEMTSL